MQWVEAIGRLGDRVQDCIALIVANIRTLICLFYHWDIGQTGLATLPHRCR